MGIHAQVYPGTPQLCISLDNQSGNSGSGICPSKRQCSWEEFWLHAESPMLISSALGVEDVHRPVRNRNLWRGLQPLKPLVIDRDKTLVNTVSMKAVAAERKG